MMTGKEEWVEELLEEFEDGSFTSMEGAETLGIEWAEFMDAFVDLNENSGRVQRAGSRGNESIYRVVGEASNG